MLGSAVRVIAWRHLAAFAERHPETLAPLTSWHNRVKAGRWRTMSEVALAFSKAKSVSSDRMRFEVVGGDYRLITAFDFGRRIVFVKFVGTHAEYDRVDAAKVSLF
jgi:mRNA interferase HigB